MYTYVPSLMDLPPTSPHPLQVITKHRVEPCAIQQFLTILHMLVYIWGFLGGSVVKNVPAMQDMWV